MVSLKKLLEEESYVIGLTASEWLRPSLVKLAQQTGFDFIYIEYEHIFIDPATFTDFVISARDNGLPVVAKTPELYRHLILKILEAGVTGIQLPRTNTATDVADLVNYCRYPPEGTRAGSTGMASTDYVHLEAAEHMRLANAELCVVGHVETKEGLQNIDQIAAQPGLDVCYVGTFDLAIELETVGDMSSPRVMEAMDRICAACQQHEVIIGANGSTPKMVNDLLKKGVHFFEGPTELDLFREGASSFTRGLP